MISFFVRKINESFHNLIMNYNYIHVVLDAFRHPFTTERSNSKSMQKSNSVRSFLDLMQFEKILYVPIEWCMVCTVIFLYSNYSPSTFRLFDRALTTSKYKPCCTAMDEDRSVFNFSILGCSITVNFNLSWKQIMSNY